MQTIYECFPPWGGFFLYLFQKIGFHTKQHAGVSDKKFYIDRCYLRKGESTEAKEEHGVDEREGILRCRAGKYRFMVKCLLIFGLLLAGVMLFYSNRVKATTQKQADVVLKEVSEQNAKLMEDEIHNKVRLFEKIAERCGADFSENSEKCLSRLELLMKIYEFEDMGVMLPDGRTHSVTGKSHNLSDEEFFQNVMNGNAGISSTIMDETQQVRVNLYSAPIFSDGKLCGAIYAVYRTEKFHSLFSAPYGGEGYSYVVDTHGDVMISENEVYENILEQIEKETPQNEKAAKKLQKNLRQAEEGNITYFSGEKKYAYYRPLGINNWSVITIVPLQSVMNWYEPVRRDVRQLWVSLAIFFGAAAGYLLRQEIKLNRKLEDLAYVDPLTGGRNNIKFMADAEKILERHKGQRAAILMADINHFRMVNELLGIEEGNEIIRKFEQTLLESCQGEEIVGHRDADHFIILWLVESHERLLERLNALCKSLDQLSEYTKGTHFTSSIGVHEIPSVETKNMNPGDIEQLLGNALLANQSLKGGHVTAYCFSSEQMRSCQMKNKILEDEMYSALSCGEFIPWFQPKIDMQTGKVCGAEALVRWKKKDETIISPETFLPLFEENGFIEKVDQSIIEQVCEWVTRWKQKGLLTVPISVNLSRTYLYSESFAAQWRRYMEERQLEASDIQFEVTETFEEKDNELLKRAIQALHTEGFTVLLDDFGIGYSSLRALQELDFDILKLDCKFIWKIGEQRTEKILDSVIEMAEKLGMETVAEGVETEGQRSYLKEHHVKYAQGYYYYKPMEGEAFERLLMGENP